MLNRRNWPFPGLCAAAFFSVLLPLQRSLASKPASEETIVGGVRSCELMLTYSVGEEVASNTRLYWTSGGRLRTDTSIGEMTSASRITSTTSPGIEIDHENKTYYSIPTQPSDFRSALFDSTLARRVAHGRRLERRTISGLNARGFEAEIADVDPDFWAGKARVWVDDGARPVEVEYEFQLDGEEIQMRLHSIHWNAPIDDELFDANALQRRLGRRGYTQVTAPKARPLPERMQALRAALQTYASLSGGSYPAVESVYPQVLRQRMFLLAGIDPDRPSEEQVSSGQYARILDAGNNGFPVLSTLLTQSFDAAYNGDKIASSDSDGVLIRWRLDDGTYQVIYGDLRDAVLTSEQLSAVDPEFEPESTVGGSAGTPTSTGKVHHLVVMPLTLDRVPACHWRCQFFGEPNKIEEGWAVRNVGWRTEIREEGHLTHVTVQTSRWNFQWDVQKKVVVASDSAHGYELPSIAAGMRVRRRTEVEQSLMHLRPIVESSRDSIDGKATEKVGFHFLADPKTDGDSPIHKLDSEARKLLLGSPDVQRRTRTFWFDAESKLVVGRKCGCRKPKWEFTIDYPEPHEIPADTFTFRMPPDVELVVEDQELQRAVRVQPNPRSCDGRSATQTRRKRIDAPREKTLGRPSLTRRVSICRRHDQCYQRSQVELTLDQPTAACHCGFVSLLDSQNRQPMGRSDVGKESSGRDQLSVGANPQTTARASRN